VWSLIVEIRIYAKGIMLVFPIIMVYRMKEKMENARNLISAGFSADVVASALKLPIEKVSALKSR
ncbi:MAG: hypothetical protein LBT70_03840, partial [Holosporaceae bacterium]|nr:hypothetical protein [Holosporaceae bacterium]